MSVVGVVAIIFVIVSAHLLFMIYAVRVLNLNVFKLECWVSIGPCVLFECSCDWLMIHAVCMVLLALFGSAGLLFSIMLFVL